MFKMFKKQRSLTAISTELKGLRETLSAYVQESDDMLKERVDFMNERGRADYKRRSDLLNEKIATARAEVQVMTDEIADMVREHGQ